MTAFHKLWPFTTFLLFIQVKEGDSDKTVTNQGKINCSGNYNILVSDLLSAKDRGGCYVTVIYRQK